MWIIILIILVLIGIGVYVWMSGDAGTPMTAGGNSIPSPPALPN